MKRVIIILALLLAFFEPLSAQNQNLDVVSDTIVDDPSVVMKVVDWYNNNLNYVSITLLMALESSFIPFPSEVVVPPAAYHACNLNHTALALTDSKVANILIVILFATLGALIGALVNYYLAYFLGRPFVYWFADTKFGHLLLLNSEKVKKAEAYFVKHGNSSTLIGRLVPGIRQLISIPAGLAKMNLAHFILFTVLGSGIWNVILAILGYIAHGQQDIINQYSHELSYFLLVLGALFVLYLLYKGYKMKFSHKNNPKDTDE